MAAEATTGAPRSADSATHPYTITAAGDASSSSKSLSESPQNDALSNNNTPLTAQESSLPADTTARAGERLASHLDMLAETVRAIVSRVMHSPATVSSPTPSTPSTPRSEYSLETRHLCVDKHAAGMSFKQIAAELSMPVTSVQTIVQRAKQQGGAVTVNHRGGRPRVTDESVEATIREIVAQNPQWSARQVLDQVLVIHEAVPVSFETIRRRVRDCRKEINDSIDTENEDEAATTPVSESADAVDKTRRKRGTEYSPEFRQLCVHKHESEGKSYQAIATELNVPPDSVRAIVRKAKRTGTVQTAPRSGRPRKTTELIDRVILQSVKNSERSTAKQIQDDLAAIYHVKVSCETIRRRARDHTKQRLQLVDPGEQEEAIQPAQSLVPVQVPIVPAAAAAHGAQKTPRRSNRSTTPVTTAASDAAVASPTSRKRKRTEYPLDIREKCVALHRDGLGYRKIGEQLKMPHTTVRAIVEKVERTGSMAPAPRSGRPRKTDEILDKVILQTVKTNAKCSARMIQQELETAFNVTVSCETIRRRVKDHMRQKHLFPEASAAETAVVAERSPVHTQPPPPAIELQPSSLPTQQAQSLMNESSSSSMGLSFPLYPLAGEPLGGHVMEQPRVMDMMAMAPFMGMAPASFMTQQQQHQQQHSMFGYAPPPHLQSLLRHSDVVMHGAGNQHGFMPTSPPSMSDFVL